MTVFAQGPMVSQKQIIDGTLAWCNDRRVERGKKPLAKLPKGRREDPASCPCGKATGLRVEYHKFHDLRSGHSGDIPRWVEQFVVLFDAGELPEYEAR